MKIVFYCYGGAHASQTAAALYLGSIPPENPPPLTIFQQITYFDRITQAEHGQLKYIGTDNFNNQIYTLACRHSVKTITNLIKAFSILSGENPGEYLYVNCLQLFNPLMVLGGYLSRGCGWIKIGRPLVTLGTYFSFGFILKLVENTRMKVASIQKNV